MRALKGSKVVELGDDQIRTLLGPYRGVVIDLGTGDGRFVYTLARADPERLYVGIDPVAENMREYAVRASRKPAKGGAPNVLFVVASAEEPPQELYGVAAEVHVNLPWGSLLRGIVLGDERVLGGIRALAMPGARIEILVNASIFTGAASLEVRDLPELTPAYVETLAPRYAAAGITIVDAALVEDIELKRLPTTWARRLGHGREPRTFRIRAIRASRAPSPAGAASQS